MENTARTKPTILITDVGSYLGTNLARNFLKHGNIVYGIGPSHPEEDVLEHRDFTFLQIDLTQPLARHIPNFDVMLNITQEMPSTGTFNLASSLSPQTANLIKLAKENRTKVIFIAPIEASTQFFDRLPQNTKPHDNVKLLLVGNVYGPNMPLENPQQNHKKTHDYFSSANKLSSLIAQAVFGDKVILDMEGMDKIFPTYIDDATYAIEKFTIDSTHRPIRFIVSQAPTRSLSVAYELQNVTRNILAKELGLFFSGPKQEPKSEPEPIIRVSDLGYEPKMNLTEGLKETLKSFEKISGHPPSKDPSQVSIESQSIQKKTDQVIGSKQNKVSRLPYLSTRYKAKKIAALILIIVFLAVAKTGLDLFLGINNSKTAHDLLISGDFEGAQKKARSSAGSFKAAYNKTKVITYPFFKVTKNQVESINNTLLAASKGAAALGYFSEGTQTYTTNVKAIIKSESNSPKFNFEDATANYQKAYSLSQEAVEILDSTSPSLFSGRLQNSKNSLSTLSSTANSALELVNFTSDLISLEGKKTYLVLLQNNMELRPGGGFIGNYATVEFENGKLLKINVDDIYNIDGKLEEKIDPPTQITEKLGTKQLYLRDSNWSTDFALNASTARDFFNKETGVSVDGVAAIDLTFIQNLLDKIGPIKLPDYNEEISAKNIFDRGEYHSEVGFFPGSTQKKDFFGSLTRNLFENITTKLTQPSSSSSPAPWTGVIQVTKDALHEKHVMLSFDDPNLASFVKSKGWDNPVPPVLYNPADDTEGTRDFLALSEANLGANKVNRYLERSIEYDMTIGRDADLVAKLTITYKNNSQANTWPGGTYVNFLRVYAPFASSLFDVQNGGNSDLQNVEVTTQNNLTVFATYVEVPVKSQKTLSFSYRIPKNIKLEQAPQYSFFIQKQPGTAKDPFIFRLNLPAYLKVKSINGIDENKETQNIELNTNIATDINYTIGIAKK